MNSIVKTCTTCGRTYTHTDWNRLPFKGRQDDEVWLTELRQCPCESTLARSFCAGCGSEVQGAEETCSVCGVEF